MEEGEKMLSERCKEALSQIFEDYDETKLREIHCERFQCTHNQKVAPLWEIIDNPPKLDCPETIVLEMFGKGNMIIGLAGRCRKCGTIFCLHNIQIVSLISLYL
jgi:hypothetical protein